MGHPASLCPLDAQGVGSAGEECAAVAAHEACTGRDGDRRDQLWRLRDRAGHGQSAEDDLLIRLPCSAWRLRRRSSTASFPDSSSRAATDRHRHRRPRLGRRVASAVALLHTWNRRDGEEPGGAPGRSGASFRGDRGRCRVDADYALLGRVTKGFDVVQKIEQLGTPSGTPKVPVTIKRITVRGG